MIAFEARLEAVLARARLELVDDWRECLKWGTVQINLLLLGVNLVAQVMPALDPQIAAMLPAPLRAPTTGIFAALVVVARVTQLKTKNA